MDESFEIPVSHNGRELTFSARLLKMGYVHKFEVDVNGRKIFFEQDDNGEYRALANPDDIADEKNTDVALLKAIAASIENILK